MALKDNVIHVDFTPKENPSCKPKVDSLNWTNQTYLEICASTLAEDDYWDLLEAIVDPKFYQTLNEDLQDLVNGYFDNLTE